MSNIKELFTYITYLFVITIFGLVVKNVGPGSGVEAGMVVARFDDRRHEVGIGQRFQRFVTNVDRVLSGALPVRVLIDDCSKNLPLMKAVIGGDEVGENSITFFGLQPVF